MVVIVLTGLHRKLAQESYEDQVEEDFEQTAHSPVLSVYHLLKLQWLKIKYLSQNLRTVFILDILVRFTKNVNLVKSEVN